MSIICESIVSLAGGVVSMGQQLELLSRDATQHNVFLAAMPEATMTGRAEEVELDTCLRLGLTAARVSPEHLHVSVLSIGGYSGSCPPTAIAAARAAAGAVSMAPFRAEFDRVASFSASYGQRALVLTGDGDGVGGFLRLKGALRHALMKAGLRLPRQPNSSPHMTMAYIENRTFDFRIEPIGWTVRRFVLIDSLVGQSRHVRLGQWYL
jgi:RNA 2',3'-cyclic 3'-phosphodiesterase